MTVTENHDNHLREFFEAVTRGDVAKVSELISAYPELVQVAGEYNKTGLHWAAESNQIDVARVLLDAGANIETMTSWGATPLDWAATMGSNQVADFLLSRGASGFTLIVAAALGRLKEVKNIVESGTDLSTHRRASAPRTPDDHWPADSAHILGDVLSDALYAAARNGHTPMVEYLLSRGANIDAKGIFGATALHWAAFNGHAGTVELLISRGANLTIRDARFDATPDGWAEEAGHSQIAATLRSSK